MLVGRIRGLANGVSLGSLSLIHTPYWLRQIEKFKTQFSYGQREILLDFLDLNRSTLLMGILQHGFSYEKIPFDLITPRINYFTRSPLWVYSEKQARLMREHGQKNVRAIGAPWLYLPRPSKTESKKFSNNNFIVFPMHTTLSVDISPNEKEIKSKIQFWRSISGNSTLTVCLYWTDYLESKWRKVAEFEGIKVTFVGVSNLDPVWSPHSSRIDFLKNLRMLLGEHTHAIFESFTSAMMYAISTGLSVGYFPDSQTQRESQLLARQKEDNWVAKEFPWALRKFAEANVLVDPNNELLGVESFCSPDKLRDLLVYEIGLVPTLGTEEN